MTINNIINNLHHIGKCFFIIVKVVKQKVVIWKNLNHEQYFYLIIHNIMIMNNKTIAFDSKIQLVIIFIINMYLDKQQYY